MLRSRQFVMKHTLFDSNKKMNLGDKYKEIWKCQYTEHPNTKHKLVHAENEHQSHTSFCKRKEHFTKKRFLIANWKI